LLAALFCLRGTLFLYQGDELGLPQAQVRFEDLRDPFARAAFTGEAGRDGARTPFPWDHRQPLAGFSSGGQAWLPVDPTHVRRAVSLQELDPDSHLTFTRRLIALRNGCAALRLGEADLWPAPAEAFAVVRRLGQEQILCAVNLTATPVSLEHPDLPSGEILLAHAGARLIGETLELGGYGLAFIRLGQSDAPIGEQEPAATSPL
jgi:alpha-glucosidase